MLRYFQGRFPGARRRFAPLFLVGGLLVVGKLAYDDVPQARVLHYVLPTERVTSLRVTYSSGDDFYGGFERRFPEGAPREFVHEPSLPTGHYQVDVELAQSSGEVTHLRRSVRVPSEAPLRILLTETSAR